MIAAYGHRYFKLKVAGSLDADIDRLARIAAVLDRMAEPYFATLDGNEQYEHVDAVDRAVAPHRRGAAARAAQGIDPVRRAADRPRQGAGRAGPRARTRGSDRDRRVRCRYRRLSARRARSAIAASRRSPARASIARCSTGRASRTGTPRRRRALLHVGGGSHHAGRRSPCSRTSRSRRWSAPPMSSATATTMSTAWPARPSRSSSRSSSAHGDLYRRADGRVRLSIVDGALALSVAGTDARAGRRRHAGLDCDAADAVVTQPVFVRYFSFR